MDATFQNYVYDLINKAVKRTLTVIRYNNLHQHRPHRTVKLEGETLTTEELKKCTQQLRKVFKDQFIQIRSMTYKYYPRYNPQQNRPPKQIEKIVVTLTKEAITNQEFLLWKSRLLYKNRNTTQAKL